MKWVVSVVVRFYGVNYGEWILILVICYEKAANLSFLFLIPFINSCRTLYDYYL